MKTLKTFLAVSITSILTACGGGGGETTPVTPEPPAPAPTVDYPVVAIDGYLQDAEIWLDLNGNGERDADEPFAMTSTNGEATLTISTNISFNDYSVVVKAIKGITFDESSNSTVHQNFLMAAPKGESVVTPLTTMVHTKIESGVDKETAIDEVAQALNLDINEVLGDFIEEGNEAAEKAAANIVSAGIIPEDANDLTEQIASDDEVTEVLEDLGELLPDLDEGEVVIVDDAQGLVIVEDSDGDGLGDPLEEPKPPVGSATISKSSVLAQDSAVCPNGGIQVETGIDENQNGVLDPSEVDSIEQVCHGTNGQDGLTSLVEISVVDAGSQCANGGSRIDSGIDFNLNGELDTVEISSTSYVCNGSNAVNHLTNIVTLNDGSEQCPFGGIEFQSGFDNNANQLLDQDEIVDTQRVCNEDPHLVGRWDEADWGSLTWQ